MVDLNWQKYPVYKSSSVEWLGDIPEHWEVKKIKRLSTIKRGASPRPIDNPKYFDDNGEFAWVRIADVTASNKYLTITTQKLSELGSSFSVKLYPGDFFISIAASVGKPIITKIKCCIHDGFVYCDKLSINVDFLYYLFEAGQLFKGLGKLGTQLNLNTHTIGNIYIPVPPNYETEAIANFLDKKLAQIDEYIAKKQRMIELLKEQKTVIINRAVTKGLNPDVPMKFSGIEWLGEIPEHWEVRKIKRCLKSYRYGISDSIRGEGKFKILTMGNIQDRKVLIPETGSLESVPEELILECGDLLFNRTNSLELVGKVGFFRGSKKDKVSFASYLVRLKANDDTNPVYLNFLLNSYGLLNVARQRALVSLNQVNLNPTRYCQLTIPLPPISEQQEIVSFIEKKSEKIERAIATIEKETKLIQEYRTTLISETVTGKIDVRKYPSPR